MWVTAAGRNHVFLFGQSLSFQGNFKHAFSKNLVDITQRCLSGQWRWLVHPDLKTGLWKTTENVWLLRRGFIVLLVNKHYKECHNYLMYDCSRLNVVANVIQVLNWLWRVLAKANTQAELVLLMRDGFKASQNLTCHNKESHLSNPVA